MHGINNVWNKAAEEMQCLRNYAQYEQHLE